MQATAAVSLRHALPKPADRLPLGKSGLLVSPFCLGLTASPDTVVAAYEAGINFFFVTGDLHWPLYDGIRKGLAKLLEGNATRRDELVVGVVSYLDDPLFSALQFQEVISEVPGLGHVDLLIAGAVSSEQSFYSRVASMERARGARHNGAVAIGATFHQRRLALAAEHYGLLDISYIRFNSAHPGARAELFPYYQGARTGLVFNFKSAMPRISDEMFASRGLPGGYWRPDAVDHYRFVLSHPEIDGILCSPLYPDELKGMVNAMDRGPLSQGETDYMIWLTSQFHAPILT